MKLLIDILTSLGTFLILFVLYLMTSFIVLMNDEELGLSVLYDPADNFSLWFLIGFGVLGIIRYIWDWFLKNTGKGNGRKYGDKYHLN